MSHCPSRQQKGGRLLGWYAARRTAAAAAVVGRRFLSLLPHRGPFGPAPPAGAVCGGLFLPVWRARCRLGPAMPPYGAKRAIQRHRGPAKPGLFLCHFYVNQPTRSSAFLEGRRGLRRANASRCPWRGCWGLCAGMVRGLVPPGPGWPILGHPMAPPVPPGIFESGESCARRESSVFSHPAPSCIVAWGPGGEGGPIPGSVLSPLLRQAGRFRFAARKPGPGSFVWPYRATNPARASAKTVSLRGGTIPARALIDAPAAMLPMLLHCAISGLILPQVIPTPAGHDHIRPPVPILAESIPSQKRQSGARSRAPGCRFQQHNRSIVS